MDRSTHLPAGRRTEHEALIELLAAHAAPNDRRAADLAERIARAACRPGHLWRAMDLASRAELNELLQTHFPELAAGNTKHMRWKKYLYKRLCGWPGFDG